MAFVLSRTYKWPVPIELGEDGNFEEFVLNVLFNRLPTQRVREVLNGGDAVKDLTDEDFCREIMAGWFDMKDDAGRDLPFSEDALEDLLGIHPAPAMIVKAWMKSIWNETAEGNSQKPPNTGQPAV